MSKGEDILNVCWDTFQKKMCLESFFIKQQLTDYKPSETSRLDKAIIKEDGNYVVYCVTDDTDKANEIIDKYFK